MKSVCVFCGSNRGNAPLFEKATRETAASLAARGITVVYGGGSVGLMGILADEALARGGKVIGVIPSKLFTKEVAHAGLTELHEVSSMHERKQLMYDLSDGFIALPGGLGTLDELCEILTWAQLGLHRKPCGLLRVGSYFDSLIDFLNEAAQTQFIKPEHRALLMDDASLEALLDRMTAFRPAELTKWIDEDSQ